MAELGRGLGILGAPPPWEMTVCFAFPMNGVGKMFSYFFLDIAWWYYQYQRGKKNVSTPLAYWGHLPFKEELLHRGCRR